MADMTGFTWSAVGDALWIAGALVAVYGTLAVFGIALLRAAFGRRHCDGCTCYWPAEDELDEPDPVPGMRAEEERLTGPVAVLGPDGRDSGQTVWVRRRVPGDLR